MAEFNYLIVGAGFAGAVCAERLASAGKRVLIIDQRDHVGGNAYDYSDEHGIRVSKHGAHIWHTNSADVHEYVSRFTDWRPYTHRVLSSTSRGLVPVPINRTTLAAFGGDLEAARQEMIVPYTRKQWGAYADQLSPTVLARIKTRDSDDDRYFTDTYQAMPADGYTAMFRRMLNHDNISVSLGTPYARYAVHLAEQVIWTGPIDQFFDYRYGKLPYRSARFVFEHTMEEDRQGVPVINHPAERFPYTRCAEFKHLTGQQHPGTSVAWERPCADGEPYWPVPTEASAALYRQYAELARQTPNVHFCGRLGSYKYLDMWQVVAQALRLSRKLLHQPETEAA